MSGQITAVGAQLFQRIMFGRSYEPVEMFYLALLRETAPNVFVTGDELDEPFLPEGVEEANSYARAPLENSAGAWDSNGLSIITNADSITFPAATSTWGTVRYWALCNAETGGDVFFIGELEPAVYVDMQDTVTIPAGGLSIDIQIAYRAL